MLELQQFNIVQYHTDPISNRGQISMSIDSEFFWCFFFQLHWINFARLVEKYLILTLYRPDRSRAGLLVGFYGLQ